MAAQFEDEIREHTDGRVDIIATPSSLAP